MTDESKIKYEGEKHGPFVRRRAEMQRLKFTTVLEYLEYLQKKHENEAAVRHLNLGKKGGYKISMKKKRRKSRKKRKTKKKKKRRKRKTRKRRR